LHTKRGQEEKWNEEGQANDKNIILYSMNSACLFIFLQENLPAWTPGSLQQKV
jgi:hypothetical protein